ncbi:MAG: YidC/Oxa1 family membrane protein insertase [Acidimicrobiales bacterium]
MADILAYLYAVIPVYPVDIALLTIGIMAVLTPLTVKSTKNMAAMQALGPEMKKLQQKYKGAENRALLNEEMMKLYKEHRVNPASGCLPMLLQMPAFLVLYDVIRGITNTVTTPAKTTIVGGMKVVTPVRVTALPRYIGTNTRMYHDIVAAHGQLNAFGMDFAQTLFTHRSSLINGAPFLLLVAASVGLQYLQMSRLNARNPKANQANPQAAMLQKYMPLIFGLIYLNIAAIINVYFVFSSGIRILTQEILFRKGIVAGPPSAPPSTVDAKAARSKNGNGSKAGSLEREIGKARPPKEPRTAPVPERRARPDNTSDSRPASKPVGTSSRPVGGARTKGPEGSSAGKPGPVSATNGSRSKEPRVRSSKEVGMNAASTGPDPRKDRGSRSGSTGSNGSASGGAGKAMPEDRDRPQAHPRSKEKRARKAR